MADMDDLDAIRRLGSHVPTEDPEAKEGARRRLRQRYDETQEPSRDRPSGRRAARWVVAVAAVVAGVLVLLALLPGGAPPSAAQTLRRLATVASEQPRPAIPAGRYLYVRSQELRLVQGTDLGTGATWGALVRVIREAWRAADGSGRILTVAGAPRWLSAADRTAWRRAGQPELIAPRTDDRYPKDTFPGRDLSGLPLDPTRLRGVLERRSLEEGPPGQAGTFSIIGILLSEDRASPHLRAALFQVAASLPDVQLIEDTRDPLGRSAVGVALDVQGYRTVLLLDPASAALRAQEQYLPKEGGSELRTWWAYWPPRVVDSLQAPLT
jgi:hypothetical protein